MRRYRDLLRIPGVARLTAAVLLGRVSTSMLNLALLVAITQRHGYVGAGLVMMVFAVVNAIAGPARGRQADRRDPRRVLLTLLAAHTVAWVALMTCLLADAPVPVLCVAVGALGATVPPVGPVVRGQWPRLVPAEQLATAYAFDATLNNITFVAGPMIAGGLLLLMPAQAVVGLTSVIDLIGDLSVAIAPTVRGRTDAPRHSGFLGPLANPRVRLLLVMIVLDTVGFGCLEVAAVAAASGQGTAGVFTSSVALGSIVSGVAYGARAWPGGRRTQLVTLYGAGAVVLTMAGLVSATVVILLAACYALYGLVNGATETIQQTLVGVVTPEGQRIEVFAWVFSMMWGGYGIGTTVAGHLVSDGEPARALFTAAMAQAIVAVIALAGLRRPYDTNT